MEKTDAEIITELGGPSALARIFGIAQASVSGWKVAGIPDSRKQTLALMYPDKVPMSWAPKHWCVEGTKKGLTKSQPKRETADRH